MRLLRLEIENFGKLSGFALDMRDGLNVLCEENGFGKSTLAAFIKAMLYGLPATTKRNLDKNERKKYIPWQGGAYGGSLEFECEKGCFRIERFFGAKEANDEFRLFDLSTQKPSSAFSSDVGIELFGIDAEGFARSAFLSQSGMDNNDENVSVTAKLTGLLEDVNDMGSYDVAMETIDKRRKFYEVKGGRGKVSDISTALAEGRRELDRLNDLLSQQAVQEKNLQEKKEEISSAEQDLRRLQEQLRLASVRDAHQAEYRRLRERLEESERERARILDAFLDRRVPTDEELSDAQRLLKEFRIAQNDLNAARLSDDEQTHLSRLRSRYEKGRPSPEMLSEIHTSIVSVSETDAALQASGVSADTRDQIRFRKTGIPTDAQLEQIERNLNRVHSTSSEKAERADGTQPKNGLLLPLSVTLLVLGILNLAAAFLFPVVKTVLLIFSVLALAAGGALLLISRKGNARLTQQRQAREQEKQTLSNEIRAFLNQYGCLPDNGDLLEGFRQLCASARRAAEDAQRQNMQSRRAEELRKSRQELCDHLAELFDRCGYTSLPTDPHRALLQIHTDLREWDLLEQRARTAQEKASRIRAELTALQERLSAFLGRLTHRQSNQPEACLARIESLCREHTIIQESIRRQRQDLSEREKEYGKDTQEIPASAEILRQQESALSQRLELLRTQQTDLLRLWGRTTEQTQKIPALEDELSHLSAELVSAEQNLTVLRRTAQLLTESKEALSTRYLGGMQAHFEHFIGLAQGDVPSDAKIDTSFTVSVREGGKSRELESFSRGTRDLLQFSARLALTKSMFENGEKPFLLLDDPFVNLDEKRFAQVRDLLDRLSEEFQILYLVCHADRL